MKFYLSILLTLTSFIFGADIDLSKFIFVEAGSFQMGSNKGESDEKPVHKVTISKVTILENMR